jgi:hypothetical protein
VRAKVGGRGSGLKAQAAKFPDLSHRAVRRDRPLHVKSLDSRRRESYPGDDCEVFSMLHWQIDQNTGNGTDHPRCSLRAAAPVPDDVASVKEEEEEGALALQRNGEDLPPESARVMPSPPATAAASYSAESASLRSAAHPTNASSSVPGKVSPAPPGPLQCDAQSWQQALGARRTRSEASRASPSSGGCLAAVSRFKLRRQR